MPEAERRYNTQASARFHARDREQINRFFDGLELAEPGLVNLSRWSRAESGYWSTHADVPGYCALARKP
jgi:hypothetical protein